MSLLEKQQHFVLCVVDLIEFGVRRGYRFTFGEAYRPRETAEIYAKQGRGIKNSTHTVRLAVDLNVFKDGEYLRRTEQLKELGEFWENIGGTWGGRFNDGNHFSFAHDVGGDGVIEK